MKTMGVVRIGKKAGRGTKKEDILKQGLNPSFIDFINYDATSASMQKFYGRHIKLDFSPMYLGPVKTKDGTALIFENFWQYIKVYEELGHIDKDNVSDKFEKFRNKGFSLTKGNRRPPEIKTKEYKKDNEGNYIIKNGQRCVKYLIPQFTFFEGKKYTYIQARKIYVKKYAKLVSQTQSFKILKERVEHGTNIQILDYDGPEDGDIEDDDYCIKQKSHVVSLKLLKDKANDATSPFGHGYVLAALLADYTVKDILNLFP